MISLAVLVLLAAAGYRGTQLLVHDSLLDPLRDRLIGWHEKRLDSTLRTAVVTLISCVYCTGWWVSGGFLLAWLLATDSWHSAPLLVHGIEWFAVAGGAVLLNRWDDSRTDGH
ncbi:DUF1360 domain-containing protein [Streptomyces sp. NPDC021019]|uniref:DUF1360 domain-containing protein n=1 Tax=Streptomyces sp. NPDC021019 TaxID=3365108 RepID=UPI003793A57B